MSIRFLELCVDRYKHTNQFKESEVKIKSIPLCFNYPCFLLCNIPYPFCSLLDPEINSG